MKKYLIVFFAACTILACKSEQDRVLASANKEQMLKLAGEKYAKKKWKDALALYDRLSNLVAGTDDYPNVLYNQAYANYYEKSYRIAGSQFKSFAANFPKDPRREEAAYMSALCFYEGSLDYNLDQTNTESAINELQDFINSYPNSERSKNINQLVDELSYKLELKAYENARQYYKMADYKAANVTFENVLNDFPSTKLRPQIIGYIMKSRYELAMNSVYDLKDERLLSALAYSKEVEKTLPNTEYSKDALDMRAKLLQEQAKFTKIKKEVDDRRAEMTARQKAAEDEAAAKNNEQQADKDAQKDYNTTRQARMDSAQTATPAPAAGFKIKR